MKNEVGLIEDTSNIEVRKITKKLNVMREKLPTYKASFEKLTVDKMRQELADEALEAKWKELNMGIDQWKHKYLYPFGNIAPIQSTNRKTSALPDIKGNMSIMGGRANNNSLITSHTNEKTRNHPSNDITLQQDSLYSADDGKILGGLNNSPRNPYDDSVFFTKSTAAATTQEDPDSFAEMTKQKYLFPEELLHNRNWFIEIQKPLAITVQDI